MKEQIHTIPIADAMANAGECPFCYIERTSEERILDFVLGDCASYMEADMREITDKAGFCRSHYKKLFDYGNSLGAAWMLKTHYRAIIGEMDKEFKHFSPSKPSLKERFKKNTDNTNSIKAWVDQKKSSCYICDRLEKTFQSYMLTFFTMYKSDSDFRKQVENCQGFCLTHFGDLCEAADKHLSGKELEDFYNTVLSLMKENMERLYEDVAWFIEKYDYKNKDADWKTSKDSIQRAMQKMKGGYPDLPAYQKKK